MKPRRLYRLVRQGRLLVARAAVSGVENKRVILRLLVDTGSSFTIIPVEVIDRLGLDLSQPLRMARMISAQGILIAPMIAVREFHCLDVGRAPFPLVAYTLPPGIFVDGLLGMEFLADFGAVIDVPRAAIVRERAGQI